MNENQKQCANQTESILAYLKKGNKITPLEALDLFGCMRLQARIYDIKKRGFDVCKSFVQLANGKKVMSYWLDVTSMI